LYGPVAIGSGVSFRVGAVFLEFKGRDELNAQQDQETPKQPTNASPKKAVEIDEDDIPF
jgi:hypothetical protein